MLRLANQLAVSPGVLGQYGRRAQTRSDHLKLVLKYLGWKPAPTGGEPLKDLEQFLQDRAMEHDIPSLLFHQAAEFLVGAHVTRPGVVTLMEMVATARTGAGALTSQKVGHLLHELPGVLHPRRGPQVHPVSGTQAQHPRGAHRRGHQPRGHPHVDASTVIVNHHYGLELARKFGSGTMSSSDGSGSLSGGRQAGGWMEARDIADWPYPAELARARAAAQGRMSG